MHIPKLTLSEKHQSSQVGYLKQFSVRETYPLHSHDYYEFFYICKGKAIHAVNGTNQLLTQGSLVFIRPDDVHRYEFVNNYDIHLISCGVDRCLIERALTYLGIDGRLLTDPDLPPSIILEGTAFTETEHKLDMVGQNPMASSGAPISFRFSRNCFTASLKTARKPLFCPSGCPRS